MLAICALGLACAARASKEPTEPDRSIARATASAPVNPASPPNPWSEFTRDLLAAHCGNCHRRDLPTAVPGALAVFDLLDNPWYGRLRDDQYSELLVRVRSIDNLPPADLETVVRFVGCARGGSCKQNPATSEPATAVDGRP